MCVTTVWEAPGGQRPRKCSQAQDSGGGCRGGCCRSRRVRLPWTPWEEGSQGGQKGTWRRWRSSWKEAPPSLWLIILYRYDWLCCWIYFSGFHIFVSCLCLLCIFSSSLYFAPPCVLLSLRITLPMCEWSLRGLLFISLLLSYYIYVPIII